MPTTPGEIILKDIIPKKGGDLFREYQSVIRAQFQENIPIRVLHKYLDHTDYYESY